MKEYIIRAAVKVTVMGIYTFEAENDEAAIAFARDQHNAKWDSKVWQDGDWEPEWTTAEDFFVDDISDAKVRREPIEIF